MRTAKMKTLRLSCFLAASCLLICLVYTKNCAAQQKSTKIIVENTQCGAKTLQSITTFVDAALAADADLKNKTISKNWYEIVVGGSEVMLEVLLKARDKKTDKLEALTAWRIAHGYLAFMLENINSSMMSGGKSADLFIKGVVLLQNADKYCVEDQKAAQKATPKVHPRTNMIKA